MILQLTPTFVRKTVTVLREGIREDSQLDLILTRFRQNRLAMVGLAMTSVYFIVALVGPLLVTKDPASMDTMNTLAPPSAEHPFGTDQYGRDVFARVVMGARLSLRVAVLVVASSATVGVILGLVAGYYRGWVDESIMRLMDVMFAFPSILLALVVIAILGPGLNNAILALAIAYVPTMVRITRGSAISIREEEYVTAAKAYGERDDQIMFREMLPNLISVVLVQATISFAFSILSEAGLSYLGLSAQPPKATWGIMISEGQTYLEIAWWASIFPGLAIMVAVLGLTFLGVGLRDALDPKSDTNMQQGV